MGLHCNRLFILPVEETSLMMGGNQAGMEGQTPLCRTCPPKQVAEADHFSCTEDVTPGMILQEDADKVW